MGVARIHHYRIAGEGLFLAVDFDGVTASVFAEHNGIAHFHIHRTRFTIVEHTAGANSHNHALIGLFLGGTWQHDATGRQHRLVQADAMAWLEADRGQYDLIFCDPPTFSNSARAEDFDTLVDSPIIIGNPVTREFTVDGKKHVLVFEGDPLVTAAMRHNPAFSVRPITGGRVDTLRENRYDIEGALAAYSA